MKTKQAYFPVWLYEYLLSKVAFSRENIFSLAEEKYGELSIEDREIFDAYLGDLIEEGVIYQIGNLIYPNKDSILAA